MGVNSEFIIFFWLLSVQSTRIKKTGSSIINPHSGTQIIADPGFFLPYSGISSIIFFRVWKTNFILRARQESLPRPSDKGKSKILSFVEW